LENQAFLIIFLQVIGADIWQQRDGSGALNFSGQFSLMLGAGAGYPPWNDLAAFRDKISQRSRIFVINLETAVRAETAYFPSVKKSFFGLKRHGLLLGE
jgi:hypothetical protein